MYGYIVDCLSAMTASISDICFLCEILAYFTLQCSFHTSCCLPYKASVQPICSASLVPSTQVPCRELFYEAFNSHDWTGLSEDRAQQAKQMSIDLAELQRQARQDTQARMAAVA